jgi:hypothetical protein
VDEETKIKFEESKLRIEINYSNGRKETIQGLDILKSKKSITKNGVRSFTFRCLFICTRLSSEKNFKHIRYMNYNFYGQLYFQNNILVISWLKEKTKKDE